MRKNCRSSGCVVKANVSMCVCVGLRPGSSQNYKVESRYGERLEHISISCPRPGGELVRETCPGRGDDRREQQSKD
jgi:hypothetical protein